MSKPFVFAQKGGGGGGGGALKGVDFRLEFLSGDLNFTSVSGVARDFKGIGSELQVSLYLVEKGRFSLSTVIASRIMSWVGQDVLDGEYDDITSFGVAPGLEFAYGPLYLQTTYSRINASAYSISSASKGTQLVIEGPSFTGGLAWRFSSLALGVSGSYLKTVVPGEKLNLSQDSTYIDTSVAFNFIYYMKMPPSRFFKGLFKR